MSRKNRQRHVWTPAEVEILRARYPDEDTAQLAALLGLRVGQLHDQAARRGIVKSAAFLSALKKTASLTAMAAGKLTQFQPGQTPWNKGIPFQARGRSAETQFKAKSMPPNYRPLGSVRLSGGFWQRKMTETGYSPRDWVPIHHIVWRASGQEIPESHALCFRDGNRANFDLANLELVSRVELMARNSVHNAGPEIAKLQQLRGAIMRQINQRERTQDECQ